MQLTVTDFKKNIKKYLTKAMQEDIYLLKYGKVVVKMSAVKDDADIDSAPDAVNETDEKIADRNAKELKKAVSDTAKSNAKETKEAKEALLAKEFKEVKEAKKAKDAENRAVQAVKPVAKSKSKPIIAEPLPTKAITHPPKPAPEPVEEDKPKTKPVRKPSTPFVPVKEPVNPADVAAVPEAKRKVRKKYGDSVPAVEPEKAKPVNAAEAVAVAPVKIRKAKTVAAEIEEVKPVAKTKTRAGKTKKV
ncbi:MAG: hypothetical protein LBK46_03410 [Oscillospiraceae bacterium]|jgi:hypothetical protein|nr:hypothetical protein [Oscillospiraceae bacterium]